METVDSHIGRSVWSSELKLPRAYHAGLLIAAISVNVMIWLLLNYRVSALVEEIDFIYFWLDLVQIAVETILLVEVSLMYFRWAFRKFLGEGQTKGKILKYAALFLAFIVSVTCVIAAAYKFLYPFSETVFLETLFSDMLIITIIGICMFLMAMQRIMERTERFKKEAELDRLAMQTDPHFVFNSFSTLSELIEVNRDSAESYLQILTELYRYVIHNRENHTSFVRDEVAFAEAYINILSFNLDGIECEIDDRLRHSEDMIPTVSLQSLVENAVKHNSHSSKSPLRIHVFKDGDAVAVKNNVQPLAGQIKSEKTGLKNLDSRCVFSSGRHMQVSADAGCFTVRLPIIHTADDAD
ncbi:MAG: histidine kinase [Paraprevotella sp.]|nr:histidine kinase [Paraprevotella sp.]